MNTYGKIALFVSGTLFGSAGIKLLTSKDVKKTYTHTTADVLRCREQVMRDVETVQENCADILADLLDEFIRRLPGVASVTVHERTCGVIIRYTGSRESLVRPLAAFSYDKAAGEISLLSHSSRALSREHKEKILFHVLRRGMRKLFLPAPIRHALQVVGASPTPGVGLAVWSTVVQVIPFHGQDADEMLRVATARAKGLDHQEMHTKVEYFVAHGIASRINRKTALIGSYHFLFEDEKVKVDPEDQARFHNLPDQYSLLYLAIGKVLSAVPCISDPLRTEARETMEALREAASPKR